MRVLRHAVREQLHVRLAPVRDPRVEHGQHAHDVLGRGQALVQRDLERGGRRRVGRALREEGREGGRRRGGVDLHGVLVGGGEAVVGDHACEEDGEVWFREVGDGVDGEDDGLLRLKPPCQEMIRTQVD